MAAMPMLAGVGLMMVCCSSSSVAAMMMGGEETPAPAAAGAGAGAEDTGPSMLKCLDTRKRGEKGWTNASNGRKEYTEAEARALCVGKKYMSLECPTKDGYEVWCADDISDMPVLADAECMGTTTDVVPGNPTNGGCDAGGGTYLTTDGLNMGGAHRGSLYAI
tara:strand:+ start:59 stop:547 length:489 start_codon:yes stop_codon:yes gene_type:complete